MENFAPLQSELLVKAKAKNACADQYRRAAKATTEEELLKVIFDNLDWCISKEIISHDYFKGFTPEIYMASGIANAGKENTGYVNSGDSNSGDSNSGDSNSGDSNSGDSNSGSWNSGYRNSGSWNSGSWNSGDRNSGYRNSGYRNSGSWNSGSWNSGDRNSGDSNSGYRNSGAFCTDKNPVIYLFNKPTNISVRDWENHKAVGLMYEIDPTIWVPAHTMTEEEKQQYPKWETTEGYLKTIPIKEAWANAWHNWSEDNKQVFLTLPNFDAAIFEEITGIKV